MFSLLMDVDRLDDGSWSIVAPWLKEPVTGSTFEDAYWKAMSLR